MQIVSSAYYSESFTGDWRRYILRHRTLSKQKSYASHSSLFAANALISAAAITRAGLHHEPTIGGGSELPDTAIHSRFIDGDAVGTFRWDKKYK